jgi:hypothetical protein
MNTIHHHRVESQDLHPSSTSKHGITMAGRRDCVLKEGLTRIPGVQHRSTYWIIGAEYRPNAAPVLGFPKTTETVVARRNEVRYVDAPAAQAAPEGMGQVL